MTRRNLGATLLLTSSALADDTKQTLTSDLVKLNGFADVYNEYVGKLQRNINDIKAGELVVKKWNTLLQ